MKFHKEGRYIIPITLLVLTLASGLIYWALALIWLKWTLILLFSVLFALILNFFRNPLRSIPRNDAQVLCPCDGKVVVIEELPNAPYFGDTRIQVSIFMSPLNVHVNRLPVGGVVRKIEYKPGKYLLAWNPKSSSDNEQTFLVVENAKAAIGFKQIAGALARRICWYISEGDTVQQGEEFGFIRFGSRMDVLLPSDAEIKVQLGQLVTGGETLLADLK